jgi:preprotein translocase subunit SecD
VNLEFTEDGTEQFSQITKDYVGQLLNIFVDDYGILSATVMEQITGGECVISNMETMEEAASLADLINTGCLPYELTIADYQE